MTLLLHIRRWLLSGLTRSLSLASPRRPVQNRVHMSFQGMNPHLIATFLFFFEPAGIVRSHLDPIAFDTATVRRHAVICFMIQACEKNKTVHIGFLSTIYPEFCLP